MDESRLTQLMREELTKFRVSFRDEMISVISKALRDEIADLKEKVKEQEKEILALKVVMWKNKDERLKEQRRALSRNVILRGIPEEQGEGILDAKDVAERNLRNIDPEIEVEKAERIGKKIDHKPRLIKVILVDKDQRNHLLRLARRNRESLPKGMYVDADRPFLDRKEAARLRERQRELRKNFPEKNVRILRGKLLVDDDEVDRENPLQYLFPSK